MNCIPISCLCFHHFFIAFTYEENPFIFMSVSLCLNMESCRISNEQNGAVKSFVLSGNVNLVNYSRFNCQRDFTVICISIKIHT